MQYDGIVGRETRVAEEHEPCFQYAKWTRTSPDHGPFIVSTTSFDLPLSSDLLYLVSSGALSTGSIFFDDHPSDTDGQNDQVRVEITAHSWGADTLNQADVCLLNPTEGKWGVGIFVSNVLFSAVVFNI